MDWDGAVKRNSGVLRRIVATMLAMASAAGSDAAGTPTRPSDDGRPPHKREVEIARPTLPRHLYRAVLRILYPAESAARRLIVVAARGLTVPPPHVGEPKPPKCEPSPTAIVDPNGMRPGARFGTRSGG